MKKLIKKILKYYGYEIRKIMPGKSYKLDFYEAATGALAKVEGYTMVSPLILKTLYEQAVFCEKNNIQGAFVECGVWKGGAVGMMAQANLKYGKTRRKIFLFDAFDDICEPDSEVDGMLAVNDVERLLGEKIATDFTGKIKPIKGVYDILGGYGTIEECKQLLINRIKYPEEKIHFFKGWFEESLENYSSQVEKIAILRLDADWYSSTKICLDHLFDKVVTGGFVIIDDYGRYEGCKKAVDDFFLKRGISPFLHYSDYESGECRYFIKVLT